MPSQIPITLRQATVDGVLTLVRMIEKRDDEQMKRKRLPMRLTALVMAGSTAFALSGCTGSSDTGSNATATASSSMDYSALGIDETAWQYDEANDVYYQIGVSYVLTPQAEDYETLGIYVPGAYMDATDNGDGTYTASIRSDGAVGDFTATTAPIVFPVNTPGYAAQSAPTEYDYDSISEYMEAGFIYVWPGLRGRDSNTDDYTGNAPWGVTDLKAAVRYVRYNSDSLPGNSEAVYVFGHSGGGAQSAVMGASGDSELYTPYLNELGAAMNDADGNALSDAIAGVMAWCPITNLDAADAAYEWNMGQFSDSGTRAEGTWTAAYSSDLAEAYAQYINGLGLTDEDGNVLMLDESDEGIYLSGTYYDYLVSTIEGSLNSFLAETEFPYTPSSSEMAGMDAGGPPSGGGPSDGEDSGSGPSGEASSDEVSSDGPPSGDLPDDASGAPDGSASGPSGDGGAPSGGAPGDGNSTEDATTYETAQDYIDALNADGEWVSYDADTNTATVTSLEGFITSQKNASKDVGAFDGVDASATENVVMGSGADGLHFDTIARDLIAENENEYSSYSDWSADYAADQYDSDFETTDSLGNDVATRMNMYNPMYYLSSSYDGYQSSEVAQNWRIRTGITQGDTANTTEVNLALALENYGVENLDFATIWGQGHTMAELSGNGTTNFIQWVTEIETGA